ncbi:MAG TPA: hypothetical protein VIK70_09570, partial [Lysobacter sp.]
EDVQRHHPVTHRPFPMRSLPHHNRPPIADGAPGRRWLAASPRLHVNRCRQQALSSQRASEPTVVTVEERMSPIVKPLACEPLPRPESPLSAMAIASPAAGIAGIKRPSVCSGG